MRKSPKFSPEVRERAVRMVFEHRDEHPSQWAAVESIAAEIGCVPQTLHTWVRQHEVEGAAEFLDWVMPRFRAFLGIRAG